MNMEKDGYINPINLNANTDFPYLVLDVINGHSYPSPRFSCDALARGLAVYYRK